MDQILSVFDLAHFMQNNTNIKVLTLGSADRIFSNHARIIAAALAGVQLSRLDLSQCEFFVGIELYEHIISQCLGVTELDVQCYTGSHHTALASLLRNPSAILEVLKIYPRNSGLDDGEWYFLREIAQGLASNTKLRKLQLDSFRLGGEFDHLLCDSSSLDNICNSNHFLEEIECHISSSRHMKECLVLNRNKNKNQVAQKKVMQYYFVGDFDLAPFSIMPVSVLAKVMSCGEGMSNKQTAIFELLRGIPDLCNVSGRGGVVLEKINTLDISCNKREKIGK
jgi:hypothetical protein